MLGDVLASDLDRQALRSQPRPAARRAGLRDHQLLQVVPSRLGGGAITPIELIQDALPRLAVLVGHTPALPAEIELAIPGPVPQHLLEACRKLGIRRFRVDLVGPVQSGREHLVPVGVAPAQRTVVQALRLVMDQPLARKALAQAEENAAMAYVAVLNQQGREDESLTWLEKELGKNEDNFNLRIFYARLLTDLKRFEEARSQFEILAAQDPKDSDVLFSLGLLYLQANRLDDAENHFIRLSETKGHLDDASYYLGRIAEERADLNKANDWYRGVSSGNNYFDAQMRIGLLLGKQNKLEEARVHLSKIRTQSDREKDILIQAEAEMLSEAKRYQDAMVVYDIALKNRHDADLLYSRAMLAEKMDRLDILEKDLRAILEKDPGNSQALNALGYTLADRTDRFDEAYELIKQALEISPNDYYVLDSMGWILYRQGRLDEAIEFLNKALAERNDPEIAAHLGEVLWVKGDKKAAQAVWDTALKQTPDDDRLHKVINRLNP